MQGASNGNTPSNTGFPSVFTMRQRAALIERELGQRLDTLLPRFMRETGFDMWLILCQEDDLDPIYRTMVPMDTWSPILQMLIFFDRGEDGGVERINLSMTDTHDLYDRPWHGTHRQEQWPLLREIIQERDPQRIGINIGSVQWAAGGLTYNLYNQLEGVLPAKHVNRLISAEPLATKWLATLTDGEIELFEHVANVAHHLLAECYSRQAIVPHVTTTHDLEWTYWEQAACLGMEMAFKPFFYLIRGPENRRRYGDDDRVIRPGDFVRSDVGIRYLRLNSDHQEWAYVLRAGENDAPAEMRALMAAGNRLQEIYMASFERGLAGNQLLERILTQARQEGLPEPKVYSHSLGLFLHEPGPLIGLPWEQECCPGRGDVVLDHNMCFTMELGVRGALEMWEGQEVMMSLEQDVVFTEQGCRLLDGRQTEFHLV